MIMFDGRGYGAFIGVEERMEQPLPTFLEPIVAEFKAQSELLKLELGAELDHDQIFDAYRLDVQFLQERCDGFKDMVKWSVKASMKAGDGDDAKAWDTIKDGIPLMDSVLLINLNADRAALPAEQLLRELKAEVETGIDRLLRHVCLWLDTLVEQEYVGLVRFTAPTTGHYYYFRPQVTSDEVGRKSAETITEDPTQPYGSRVTYTTKAKVTVRTVETLERHDHHIVRAEVNTLESFQQEMPRRAIEQLLNRMPAWLRPHLRVVSGEIVQEHIQSRVARDDLATETVISVWKGSPAIAFGNYALLGWSGDDLLQEATAFWNKHVVPGVVRTPGFWHRNRLRLIAAVVIAGALWALVAWIDSMVHTANEATRADYRAWYQHHTRGHQIFTIPVNHHVQLSNGATLYYMGSRSNGRDIKPVFSTVPEAFETDGKWFVVDNDPVNGRESLLSNNNVVPAHGTVRLLPIGIPADMNVLSVNGDEVTITVDYLDDASGHNRPGAN
ncbi:MAG: hypothetical protein V4480_01215 [Patescibacteria group bacterium]